MTKHQFLAKTAIPIFICGFILCSLAYIPSLRYALNIDSEFNLAFSTLLIFMIGGYMAGVGAMIFLIRNALAHTNIEFGDENNAAIKTPHWLGFLLYLPIPFFNFLVIYLFWLRDRANNSRLLEMEYRKSLNFQITTYLFALLCFFLAPVVIGFFLLALVIATHFLSTLYMALIKYRSTRNYPININILPTT